VGGGERVEGDLVLIGSKLLLEVIALLLDHLHPCPNCHRDSNSQQVGQHVRSCWQSQGSTSHGGRV
jgi:hypothetical protein